jgi:hypothetical protein
MEDELDGGTLIDVPRLFVDDAFMKYKSSKIKNPVVKSFWQYEYANTGDREKQEPILRSETLSDSQNLHLISEISWIIERSSS